MTDLARHATTPTARADRHEQGCAEILEAAARFIAERGFHGMSMRELAKASGHGLSSLYNYFQSKDELLFEIQGRAFETLHATASHALAGVETAAGRLYVFIYNHVRYVADHPEVMRVLVHEAGALPAERRNAVRALKERYFALGRGLVADVAGQGCERPGGKPGGGVIDAAELDRATYSLFGMVNWVWAWHEPGEHGGPEEIARTIHTLALCGVGATCPFRAVQDELSPHVHGLATPSLMARRVVEKSAD